MTEEGLKTIEMPKEEIHRVAQLVKDRIDSMLSRIDSASEEELVLIGNVINDANYQFDKMASTTEWMQALSKSNR